MAPRGGILTLARKQRLLGHRHTCSTRSESLLEPHGVATHRELTRPSDWLLTDKDGVDTLKVPPRRCSRSRGGTDQGDVVDRARLQGGRKYSSEKISNLLNYHFTINSNSILSILYNERLTIQEGLNEHLSSDCSQEAHLSVPREGSHLRPHSNVTLSRCARRD